ncbi:hypothetical protein L209DRAFT_47619 [Thermothelomyces heterothallicus CBS 203.75]
MAAAGEGCSSWMRSFIRGANNQSIAQCYGAAPGPRRAELSSALNEKDSPTDLAVGILASLACDAGGTGETALSRRHIINETGPDLEPKSRRKPSTRRAGCSAGVRTDAVSQGDNEEEIVLLLGSGGPPLVCRGLTHPFQSRQTGFVGALRLQGVEEIRGWTSGLALKMEPHAHKLPGGLERGSSIGGSDGTRQASPMSFCQGGCFRFLFE